MPLYTGPMQDAEHVHFVELAGADARARLEAQAARWSAQGVASRMLRSDDQDDLWLLVGYAATLPSAADVTGARVWRFRAAPELRP